MGKGKRQRERAARKQGKPKGPKPEGIVMDELRPMSVEEEQDKGLRDVPERKVPPLPNGGYHFRGDMLFNGRGEPIGRMEGGKLVAL